MALWQRRPPSVVHRSDQGSQYTSYAFGERCRESRVAPFMVSVGDCFYNAMAEACSQPLNANSLTTAYSLPMRRTDEMDIGLFRWVPERVLTNGRKLTTNFERLPPGFGTWHR